jgi:replicative DNA helicase
MAEANIPRIVNFQRGELWIHAGFIGDGKTLFALNVAYDRAQRGENCLFVSLEQKRESILNKLYAIHSSTLAPDGRRPLNYKHIRDSRLNPEEVVLYQKVVDDLQENPAYGQIYVWQPKREVTVNDIKLYAESIGKIDLIVVDHSGLVEPRKAHRNHSYAEALNSVIREAKEMAEKGVPLLLLHQINRRSRIDAENNNGVYERSAFGFAREALGAADHATASFLDGRGRKMGCLKLSILKTREEIPSPLTFLHVDFSCRRLQPFKVC